MQQDGSLHLFSDCEVRCLRNGIYEEFDITYGDPYLHLGVKGRCKRSGSHVAPRAVWMWGYFTLLHVW